MRHFLLIAISSLCLLVSVPSGRAEEFVLEIDCANAQEGTTYSAGDPYWFTEAVEGPRWVLPKLQFVNGIWVIRVYSSFSNNNPAGSNGVYSTPWQDVLFGVAGGSACDLLSDPPPPAPLEEYDFEFPFGPEYGGSVVTLYAADGTVLASYTIPVGGTVLEGGVSAASLEGAYWDVDGIFAGSIDDPTAAPNTTTARPAYDFGFAPSFEGGEWKAERSDGLVVGGGVIVPGSTDVGRVTVGQGDEVTVWTRVPAGDGMGSGWVATPVSLPPVNTTTSYFFTSSTTPTNVPAPVPTPTPFPIPSPAPASGLVTTNVTTNNFAPDQVVTLDVSDAEVPDPDFGAVELVEEVQGVFGKVAEGYENFAEAFTTGALTFNAFKNLYLPPPGLNCTFEMGPVSINLSSMLPGWVRGASKLVFLFAALGAMMRILWEAFA